MEAFAGLDQVVMKSRVRDPYARFCGRTGSSNIAVPLLPDNLKERWGHPLFYRRYGPMLEGIDTIAGFRHLDSGIGWLEPRYKPVT